MWHTWESSPHASRSSPAQGRNASSTCNLAILNFNDPAALLRNARIVGDNDYRAAILMQFLEYAHNFLRCSGIQRSRWFIRKNQSGLMHNGSGDRTRCFWPPDSLFTGFCAMESIPNCCKACIACTFASRSEVRREK